MMIRIKVAKSQTFFINGVELGVNRTTVIEVLGDAEEVIFPSGHRMTHIDGVPFVDEIEEQQTS